MFLLKHLHEDDKNSAFRVFACCGLTWVLWLLLGPAWHGVLDPASSTTCLGAAGACFLWGEEFMSGDAEMLQNLVIDLSQS